MIPIWTIDFETFPIGPRPDHNPPWPVGVAIRNPDGESTYLSWGHPSGNNCTWDDAASRLHAVWQSDLPVVFHNAKFDTSICYERFGLPRLPWDRVHDTMFLAFLLDPYARTLGLKKMAEIWLGMPPDERDEVEEWVLANKARLPRFPWIKNSKGEPGGAPTKRNAGAWIGYAPGELVGPYAIGDVDRTWKLFQVMMPAVQDAGMQEAYDVERQVLPIFMENERVGLRVDMERLESDVALYRQYFGWVEDWLRQRLNATGLNFDADDDVADVLDRLGVVTEWAKTATGKRSTSKDNMHPDMFNDPEVANALGYRNRLKTCLKMFMEPWLEQAAVRGGWISTEWNQISGENGGTRTGRPSTRNPNFLNISKSWTGRGDGYVHPAHLNGLPELPKVRRYILPDEGHIILKRDFSGQELRVFAHGSQGRLLEQYGKDPNLDVHQFVGDEISVVSGDPIWSEASGRTRTKAMNFQGLYGGGIPALMKALRISRTEAQKFKAFHDQALPDRRVFSDTLGTIVRSGRAIRTYGGRLYVRPPFKKQKSTGAISDADYILINYYGQGSAADITKRAMIALHNHPDYSSRFMLQVYDELDISSPADDAARQMNALRESMEGIPLRVPLLSDGEWGRNWGDMEKLKDG